VVAVAVLVFALVFVAAKRIRYECLEAGDKNPS
jgi:hypothetical protein